MSFVSFLKSFFREKEPVIKDNTFLLWEPCSKSHSEVVPGYAKYLRDLGYHVSVLLTPQRLKEGLFSRYKDDNITLNKLNQKEIRRFFMKSDLSNAAGAMVTTVGKLCDEIHFDESYLCFNKKTPHSKLLFVSHEAKSAVDAGLWNKNLITLRKLNYKDAKSVVINPHYFGDVKITPKNKEITNFITIGAIQGKRKNNDLIINAAKELHEKGIHNFKITVIGKGHLKKLPKEIQKYFDIKGRLPFDKMYDEIEKADFMLTSYDKNNPKHQRYNTTGTSGNFQLVYGFLKPCIIVEEFAALNGFDRGNSILYRDNEDYCSALIDGINMSGEDYSGMQEKLKEYEQKLYIESLNNLKNLIGLSK